MTRHKVMQKIKAMDKELRERGVVSLYLFGSVVRDQAGPNSDVDLLVEFDHQPGLLELFNLRFVLEGALACQVDLIPHDCLREEYREQVYREMQRAA